MLLGKLYIVVARPQYFASRRSGYCAGCRAQARKYFIDRGYLEAIIGLPGNPFYGTGIPACILVMSKQDAAQRDHVLLIDADREHARLCRGVAG